MSSRINFKLDLNGTSYKFASTLEGEELFAAVTRKVAIIMMPADYRLFWKDDESNCVLESLDDLLAAVDFAKMARKSPSKHPCVLLVVQHKEEAAATAAAPAIIEPIDVTVDAVTAAPTAAAAAAEPVATAPEVPLLQQVKNHLLDLCCESYEYGWAKAIRQQLKPLIELVPEVEDARQYDFENVAEEITDKRENIWENLVGQLMQLGRDELASLLLSDWMQKEIRIRGKGITHAINDVKMFIEMKIYEEAIKYDDGSKYWYSEDDFYKVDEDQFEDDLSTLRMIDARRKFLRQLRYCLSYQAVFIFDKRIFPRPRCFDIEHTPEPAWPFTIARLGLAKDLDSACLNVAVEFHAAHMLRRALQQLPLQQLMRIRQDQEPQRRQLAAVTAVHCLNEISRAKQERRQLFYSNCYILALVLITAAGEMGCEWMHDVLKTVPKGADEADISVAGFDDWNIEMSQKIVRKGRSALSDILASLMDGEKKRMAAQQAQLQPEAVQQKDEWIVPEDEWALPEAEQAQVQPEAVQQKDEWIVDEWGVAEELEIVHEEPVTAELAQVQPEAVQQKDEWIVPEDEWTLPEAEQAQVQPEAVQQKDEWIVAEDEWAVAEDPETEEPVAAEAEQAERERELRIREKALQLREESFERVLAAFHIKMEDFEKKMDTLEQKVVETEQTSNWMETKVEDMARRLEHLEKHVADDELVLV